MPDPSAIDLAADVTTLAICVRLRRSDGFQLGLTTHDAPIRLAGLLYQSTPGLTLSAIRSGSMDAPELGEVSGPWSDEAISANDIVRGRYDEAAADMFLVDWAAPDRTPIPLATGFVRQTEHTPTSYTLGIVSGLTKLAEVALPAYSPFCRALFTGAQCGVNMALWRKRDVVVAVDPIEPAIVLQTAYDGVQWRNGRIRVASGPAAAEVIGISGSMGRRIMVDWLPTQLSSGDQILLEPGCDKQSGTCRTVYNNFVNFRGEPNIPGEDSLLWYQD